MNGTWLKEAKELKRQRVAVEKEVISVLHALQKENPTAVSELEVISRSYDADRLREREALIAQCERLKVETAPDYLTSTI